MLKTLGFRLHKVVVLLKVEEVGVCCRGRTSVSATCLLCERMQLRFIKS